MPANIVCPENHRTRWSSQSVLKILDPNNSQILLAYVGPRTSAPTYN